MMHHRVGFQIHNASRITLRITNYFEVFILMRKPTGVSPPELAKNTQVALERGDQVISILAAHESVFITSFYPHKPFLILLYKCT
jgi:hypothetical protein